jgi:putative ABC transport system substrate-binding protein
MRRRTILLGALVNAAAAVLGHVNFTRAANASPRRIGFITGGPPEIISPNVEHFVSALAELGWTEGRDFVVLYRGGAGRIEQYSTIVVELIAARIDLLVVQGPAELSAARAVTTTLPIIFIDVPDPIAVGAVASLARPGGNATGLSSIGVDLAEKRLELLAEIIPALRRAGEVITPGMSNGEAKLAASRAAADRLGIEVVAVVVQDAAAIEPALAEAAAAGIGGLLVQLNAITIVHREELTRLVGALRLPAIYEERRFVDAGGLMSYGGNVVANSRRAAVYADRIFNGFRPDELPVEQSTKFELVVNLQSAKALGLAVPSSLLARADEVIE